jgi:hypothetical protein
MAPPSGLTDWLHHLQSTSVRGFVALERYKRSVQHEPFRYCSNIRQALRKILNKQGATGFQMAQYAFSANGPFTKLLSHNQLEYEGTRDLFFGAFRLYRNPSAHSIVGYSAGEARGIIKGYSDL